jgi:orotidine-5'-phosphate decarboxylase
MTMTSFADRLQASIVSSKSALVAGCDPVLDKLPSFLLEEAQRATKSDSEFIERALSRFGDIFLASVTGKVAAIKPNIAFFEQYGLAGLNAFKRLCDAIRVARIPLIIDAKRGDIGSTAAAYSAAFISGVTVRGSRHVAFECDALTINPFLGFDTLEPFVTDCERYGKGLFILLQTSNPGAKDIQGLESKGKTVSGHIAEWLATNARRLEGECGFSGLGAVVGASYPDEARALRATLPTTFFLMPGFGAQGAGADDATAGFATRNGARGGALVNVSRGLLEGRADSEAALEQLIRSNTEKFNSQLRQALG